MIVDEIAYVDEEHTAALLERLQDAVFHLTTKAAFDQIRRDGFIFHNRYLRFALNTASENSFGRNRGWVCLFDLRGHSRVTINETLTKYYFLEPSWFKRHKPQYTESNLAYLFLNPKVYREIVPNEMAASVREETNRYEHYVPKTECWYPSDMPLTCVEKALLVRIYKSAPKDNPFLYAHHQLVVERERKKGSG